jgi:hypothetical protein
LVAEVRIWLADLLAMPLPDEPPLEPQPARAPTASTAATAEMENRAPMP